jgi:two-component system chemotaxis sensor kinase CheA
MSDQEFLQRLRGIFDEEAREHLAQIDVGLVALEQAQDAQRAALVERLLKVLHTLKGAARTVDELELERLCHALESVLAAARDWRAGASAEQFDLLHRAANAARQVVDAPGLRSRKVAGLLAAQLDAAARGGAGTGSPGGSPGGGRGGAAGCGPRAGRRRRRTDPRRRPQHRRDPRARRGAAAAGTQVAPPRGRIARAGGRRRGAAARGAGRCRR